MQLHVVFFISNRISKTCWVCLWKNLVQAQNVLTLCLFIKNFVGCVLRKETWTVPNDVK